MASLAFQFFHFVSSFSRKILSPVRNGGLPTLTFGPVKLVEANDCPSSMQHRPHQQAPPPHLQQHHRPPSVVHQHQSQAAPPPQGYSTSHYPAPPNSGSNAPSTPQEALPYYQSNYSTANATSGYTSAGKSRLHVSSITTTKITLPYTARIFKTQDG